MTSHTGNATGLAFSIISMAVCAVMACGSPGTRHAGVRGERLRGLYVPNRQANSIQYITGIVTRGKPLGINMLVLDAHPFMTHSYRIDPAVIAYCKKERLYVAARIVCFQDGLKALPVPEGQMERLFTLIETAAGAGFDEIQLDYIRFPDGAPYYSLTAKYGFIDDLLKRARAAADRRGIILSADLFGRVVFNRDDIIGQKVENFARYAHVLYPMLYPSHFTGDRARLASPGETVREGTLKGLARVRGTGVRIQPFIQAFPYNIQWARVPLTEYVRLQVAAAEATDARGWVAWNAKGDYEAVFGALSRPE